MENKFRIVLSDYQRAILNEMGISSWQFVNEHQTPATVENQTVRAVTTSSKVTSKIDALDKLKQLKAQTQTTISTDSILVTLSPSDVHFRMFTDVLIALDLETTQQKYISVAQLNQFSGYPLSWVQGEQVSFNHKQLTTPALAELHYPNIKKLLWQQLHSALSLAKIN